MRRAGAGSSGPSSIGSSRRSATGRCSTSTSSSCSPPTVRFGALASVGVGPGLLSFAAVVVLTLLATWSFDPKLIWREPPSRWLTPEPPTSPRAARAATIAAPPGCRSRWRRRGAGTSRWSGWCRSSRSRSRARCWCARVFLTGPRIEIEFKSADGVEPGKTEIRYKEVVIGKVVSVSLRDDRKRVVVGRPARPFGGRLRGRGHHLLGRAAAHRHRAASAASARCSRAPTSAPMPASPRPRASRSSASRRRRWCCAASPARCSCCKVDDLGSLDVGSPVFHSARRSAASSATRSTRSATSCR